MFYCLVGGIMIAKKIEIKDEVVIVHLDNRETFTISLNTYLENNILINEEISDGEIKALKNKDKFSEIRSVLINKISRKKLSKRECLDFLLQEGVSKQEADSIVGRLERQYLVNDKELLEDLIHYYVIQKKGINVIKQKVLDRKISIYVDEDIFKYIDIEKYNSNINYLLEKYKKISKNKSKVAMKNYLKNKMIENGYNIDEFQDYISVECIDEYETVEKEINKFFQNRENNNENIVKITKKLLSKGFNYDIIKAALRSVN